MSGAAEAAWGHRPRPLAAKVAGHVGTTFAQGAGGLALRLRALGASSYIARSVVLRHPAAIACGRSCQVHHGAVLCGRTARRGAGLVLGNFVIVREYAYLDAHGGHIELEEGSFVGQGCVLYGQGGLRVGRYALLGPHVCISASRHTFAAQGVPIKFQPEEHRGVEVGDDVWIGAGATLLAGVRVGRGAVVGAGAVVTAPVDPWTVVAGVPARPIGRRGDGPCLAVGSVPAEQGEGE